MNEETVELADAVLDVFTSSEDYDPENIESLSRSELLDIAELAYELAMKVVSTQK